MKHHIAKVTPLLKSLLQNSSSRTSVFISIFFLITLTASVFVIAERVQRAEKLNMQSRAAFSVTDGCIWIDDPVSTDPNIGSCTGNPVQPCYADPDGRPDDCSFPITVCAGRNKAKCDFARFCNVDPATCSNPPTGGPPASTTGNCSVDSDSVCLDKNLQDSCATNTQCKKDVNGSTGSDGKFVCECRIGTGGGSTSTPVPPAASTSTPVPTVEPTPTSAPPPGTTTTPIVGTGGCMAVQHCSDDNETYFEYCGDCTGAGCTPGFTCRRAGFTCRTYPSAHFYFDKVYPVPCERIPGFPTSAPTETPVPGTPTTAPTETPIPTIVISGTPLPGLCPGVQHCTNGTEIAAEYCGECTGASCAPGYSCRQAGFSCKTFKGKHFTADVPYPIRCDFIPTPTIIGGGGGGGGFDVPVIPKSPTPLRYIPSDAYFPETMFLLVAAGIIIFAFFIR